MGRVNLNLPGDRCTYPARGLNTLRFTAFKEGPGNSTAWAVGVYARLVRGGPLVSLGISYTYAAAGTNSGPHVIPACHEIAVKVDTPQETGAASQAANYARVEAVLTAE